MPFAKVNEINLYYNLVGDGPPLCLIGGFSQHSLMWSEIAPKLAEHFQLILLDNRGAGQSEAPVDAYSIELLAEDIAALFDHLKIDSAHVMGQSMGTCIAMQLCIAHKERVKKAVLCAPFAHLPAIARNNVTQQLKLLREGVELSQLIRLNASWMLSNELLSDPAKLEDYTTAMLHNPYPITMEGLLGQADALFACDLRPHLEKIPHEVHLLVGERDIDTPVYCAKEIQSKIPRCTMHLFRDMGHLFPYEIPDHVADHALKFLLHT